MPQNPGRGPRRRDVLRGATVAGLTGLTGLAGCSSGDAPRRRSSGGTYTVGVESDATTMNVLNVSDALSAARIELVLDGPYAVTPDLEVFPLWCDVTTTDNRVYEVELREGLRWSDPYGAMTADDWVYMIREVFMADENWAGYPSRDDWKVGGEFIGAERTGTRTFELTLPETDPAFRLRPVLWGEFCMPKGLLERYVPDRDLDGLKRDQEVQTLSYAGNLGPYRFERWDRGSAFVAVRNEEYYMRDVEDAPPGWKGAPYFDRFVYRVIPEESTRLLALENDQVSEATIPETRVEGFETVEGVSVNAAPQPFLTVLAYNMRANGWEPFRRLEVRQALSWVVDKRVIVEDIMRGHGEVAHTFQPEWSRWYDDSQVRRSGLDDTYDPAEARSRLADALAGTDYGYDDERVVGPDGEQTTLRLAYASESPVATSRAEFVAQEYDDVGIAVDLDGVPLDTLFSRYVVNAPEGGDLAVNGGLRDESTSPEPWDLLHGPTFNTYPRTPTASRPFFVSDGASNFYGYVPEANVGALYDRAASAADDERRAEALAELFGVLSVEQPVSFLAMGVELTGYRSNVVGPVEAFGNGWNSQTWAFR